MLTPVFSHNRATSGGGFTAATQAEMEAASSTTVGSTPGRQHFHPGSAKCWGYVTVSGGTPTLQTSYNITSITDEATGDITFTIATDFSTANWCSQITTESTIANDDNFASGIRTGGIAAGTLRAQNFTGGGTLADPPSWHMVGFGDQA